MINRGDFLVFGLIVIPSADAKVSPNTFCPLDFRVLMTSLAETLEMRVMYTGHLTCTKRKHSHSHSSRISLAKIKIQMTQNRTVHHTHYQS